MIRYNSLEVSEKLFCHEPGVKLWNNTIAFIAPVVFLCCTNDRDGYSHGLIFFHGRSIFWKTLLLTIPSLLDFLTFVLILSTGDYIMLTSLSKLLPGKWPRASSYIHDSSSLARRNSHCVHHNVSNSLLPLTVFGRESCLNLSYPLE